MIGDVEQSVLASGTLKPVKLVAVGARVSGRVTALKVSLGQTAAVSDRGCAVCLLGGIIGIVIALAFGVVCNALGSSFSLVYSPTSIVAAFLCSTLIGIAFGYLPARSASLLDPVVALSR